MTIQPAEQPLREVLWASQTLLAAELDLDGLLIDANPALQEWAGRSLAGAPFSELLSATQRPVLDDAVREAGDAWRSLTIGLYGGGAQAAEDHDLVLRRDGDRVLVVAEPARRERDRLVEQVLELNDDIIRSQRELNRRQRELERARAEAEASTDLLRRLESVTLAGFADEHLEDVLASLLQRAVEVTGADRASLLLIDELSSMLHLRASVGGAPPPNQVVQIPIGRGVAGRIARSRRGEIVPDLSAVEVVSPWLRKSGGSLAGVPLILDDHVIGVLHVSVREVGHFGPPDLRLLELVGERASLAVGHAQLRERERTMAETLQRTLLPDHLDTIPATSVTARYVPVASSVHLGGDFYDAIELSGGRLGLAIGDVAGKGLKAAATMGGVRSSLRALAQVCPGPAAVLDALDRLFASSGTMTTVAYAVLDPAARTIEYARAGHPPLLLRHPDGPVDLLEGALSPPIGLGTGERVSATTHMPLGGLLLLYTDGLIERRDEVIDVGLAALREAVRGGPRDPDALADALLRGQAGADGFGDDVALLGISLI